ncbi:DUF1343 domain-containing protein, partial [Flavihumibacter sp. CACIAM 22H1]|uniref:exo-beta-N-acetylmuramidase NamZ family protein n=1 Tax=Flavihumibacter sp. CACIAM 22H1 TaxID=1812911 RepID=UPI0007A9023A
GLLATGADGARQPDGVDNLTHLPITSLYGQKMAPAANDLADLDGVLFDIPDVGCRFYTYLWTLTLVMEVCAREQKKLLVLDRPNPIGGDLNLAEGPWLDEKLCSSFIGRWSIPVRHSCTLGELALYFAAKRLPELALEIVPVNGWSRKLMPAAAGWLFHPTSPAIRDIETALLYPGTGLLEGVFVNEGRGTDRPFTKLGAPWLQGAMLADAFNSAALPGVYAKPVAYTPEEGVYEQQNCGGIQLQVIKEEIFRPVQTGIAIIRLLHQLFPLQLKERQYYTAANPSGSRHLDKLLGIPDAYQQLISGNPVNLAIEEAWQERIQPYLLYS